MTSVFMLALPFIACVLLTAMLSYLGLHVLKREVIFIDIAVAQVAALGAIAAHMVFHLHGDSPYSLACAVGATMLAALFFAFARRHVSQLPIEATIGITYAIVAAGALFMIGKSACGHTHVQEMLTGSMLWVTWQDLLWTAIVFAIAGGGFALCHKPLQEISDDYHGALTRGRHVAMWDFVFYALCGIVITFAVRLAGVVVVFCFLIIPATLSALFATQWRLRMLLATATGVISSIAGLIFSQLLDFSAGVSVSLFLGMSLLVAAIGAGAIPQNHTDRTD